LDTASDLAGVPIALPYYDLRRPISDVHPLPGCPAGNPCYALGPVSLGSYAYSGDVIAWVECAPDVASCYGDPTADLYYAVPEPSGPLAGLAMLLALVRVRRPRIPAGPP